MKHKILQAARVRKPNNVYFNESMSRRRNTIRHALLKAKKDYPGSISSLKTEDVNIRVFTPPLQSGGLHVKTTVNTPRQLDEFFLTKFGFKSSKYVKFED